MIKWRDLDRRVASILFPRKSVLKEDMNPLINNAKENDLPKLLDARGLLETVWPDPRSRPSLRWLRQQQKNKTLPFIKWERSVFFDPSQVARIIEDKLTIHPRGLARMKVPK